jgi:lysophospholipase L1-like esterase
MMKFRTEIQLAPASFELLPGDHVALHGSCFSDHIAAKLERHGFVVARPSHGILFHPLAIVRALHDVTEGKQYTHSDLVFRDELWHSLAHHGAFSGRDRDDLLNRINGSITQYALSLVKARLLVVTLGTAWAWRWKESGEVVGNCHKLPGQEFTHELISYASMKNELSTIFSRLRQFNPDLEIVLTVSPVRHWREGAEANMRSKAHLILLAHELISSLSFVHYFPAFEFFMDDLRDYRFYSDDLIHPAPAGISYVWEKFTDWCMSRQTKSTIDRIGQLSRIYDHRPVDATSDSYLQALDSAEKEIRRLLGKE